MSEENVEVIRNVFAMIDRGDAQAWNLLPSDFVIDLSRRLIDPVVLRGADEMRAFYRDLDATWSDGAKVEVDVDRHGRQGARADPLQRPRQDERC